MIEPLDVVCVLKQGPHFSKRYVEALARGLKKHTPAARLVCFADIGFWADEVKVRPLPTAWPGWWSKMNLFRPGLLGDGLHVYLDLDTVVTGDISPLFEYEGDIAILRDFNLKEHRQVRGLPAIGSAVLLWRGDAMKPVWDAFFLEPGRVIHDHAQRMDHFIRKHLPPNDFIQDLWPGLVACAKDGFKGWRRQAPAEASLLCTWGGPRIHELAPTHWYRRLWEG